MSINWNKYNIVTDIQGLKDVDSFLMNEDDTCKFNVMALDTETNGLELYKATVVGFSFSVNSNFGVYVPLLKWIPESKSLKKRKIDKIEYESFMDGHLQCVWTGKNYHEFVKPNEYQMPEFIPVLVERWFSKTKLIMHNAPFDTAMISICMGVDLKEQILSDTGLLVHINNENAETELKLSAQRFATKLGYNSYAEAANEKRELKGSIIKNGGKSFEVWRADLEYQGKYACADTFLTFGLHDVILDEINNEFGEKAFKWIYEEEVMPVCREVVVDMKRRGVYIDVDHFKKLDIENEKKMLDLEDDLMKDLDPYLDTFDLGKSIDEAVSHQRLIKKIIELEGLSVPKVFDKKTNEYKESLAQKSVKDEYKKNPHWIWAYILGEDEIKYSEQKIKVIKQALYEEVTDGKRYRFNINSSNHLAWLFCNKLGFDRKELPQTKSATADNPIPSMEADTLREYFLPKFSWVKKMLLYKKLEKLQSGYIKPALILNINGWLYMNMKQNGTTSGRFSCSGGFNLQTLPRVDDELEALNECKQCKAERFNKDGSETDYIVVEEYIECMANRHCQQCGLIEYDIPRPSAIKKGFIAPPGYKILNADYSSLEPRCFAVMSNEDKIKAVYRQGLDLYSKVYCDMFDKENKYSANPKDQNYLKKINNKARAWVKPLVLGIPYGAHDSQVANMIGEFSTVTDKETGKIKQYPNKEKGKQIRDQYLDTYPNLEKYMDQQDANCVNYGYVDSIVGRRKHFEYAKKINEFLSSKDLSYKDLIYAPKYHLRGPSCNCVSDIGHKLVFNENELTKLLENLDFDIEKVKQKGNFNWSYIRGLLKADVNNSKNHPIQALAGHITNMGMLVTTRLFKENNIDGWVCLQVHDEISCYIKEEQAESGKELLKKGMQDNIYTRLLDIPMIADPVICDSLKESK